MICIKKWYAGYECKISARSIVCAEIGGARTQCQWVIITTGDMHVCMYWICQTH